MLCLKDLEFPAYPPINVPRAPPILHVASHHFMQQIAKKRINRERCAS